MATTTYTDTSMSIRGMGARTDFAASPVTDLTAEEDRLIHALLTEGVLSPANGWLPVVGAAATMNVIIGSGSATADIAIVDGEVAGQNKYVVRLDDATKTLALSAADPTNPRIDEVYLVVRDDAYDSSGVALPSLAVREGTPAGSPAAPGVDAAWKASLLLASIAVPAAAADIEACTLTDSRVYAGVSLAGGLVIDRTAANNETRVRSTGAASLIGLYVNGTKEAELSATTLNLQGNTVTNVGAVDGADISAHAHTGADGTAVVSHTDLADQTTGDPHTQYLLETGFTKAAIDALAINADMVDGLEAAAFALTGHNHAATYLAIAAQAADSALLGGKAEAALAVLSATKWATARTLTLTGDVTGVTAAFDGQGNITLATVVGDDTHTHGTSTVTGLGAKMGAGSHANDGSDITVQSGGSPGGGQNGDIVLIY